MASFVLLMTSGRRATLQIMIERLDDLPITLDDCTQISHSVSSLLDVADPIAGGLFAGDQLAGDRPPVGPQGGLQPFQRLRGQDRTGGTARRTAAVPWAPAGKL